MFKVTIAIFITCILASCKDKTQKVSAPETTLVSKSKRSDCVYDLYYMDIGKPFSYFVRKVRKNRFKMLEITDLTDDTTKIGKRNWKQFSM
jgi:hypothetical protein